MNLLRTLLAISFIVLAPSAIAQDSQCTTQNTTAAKEGFRYFLPVSKLKISILTREEIIRPGIYSDYSKKMIGIEPLKGSYRPISIQNINIIDIPILDTTTEYYFTASSDAYAMDILNKYENLGWVLFQNARKNEICPSELSKKTKTPQLILANDDTYEKYDTVFRTVVKDSVSVRIPVVSKSTAIKTLEMKAKDAAEMISTIEKNKLAILESILDHEQNANTIAVALEELERLKQQYIQLFTGTVDTITKDFFIILSPEQLIKNATYSIDKERKWTVTINNNNFKTNKLPVFPLKNRVVVRQSWPLQVIINEDELILFKGSIAVSLRNCYQIIPLKK